MYVKLGEREDWTLLRALRNYRCYPKKEIDHRNTRQREAHSILITHIVFHYHRNRYKHLHATPESLT